MRQDGKNLFLGVAIDTKPLSVLTSQALSVIDNRKSQVVFACANPHSLVVAQTDRTFSGALNNADQVVADGVGVTMMAKVAGVQVGPRITGTDYFLALMGALNRRGAGRIFFLGSSEKVLNLIVQKFPREFPKLELSGTLSPPFRSWTSAENASIIAAINAARPDILWVGMTAPKQEKWVYENRDKLAVPVVGSIGAVFDFFAGTYPRAPNWMCRIGMEWAYRLIKEPRRMWRRNILSSPIFVALVLWRHVFGVE